MDRLGGCLVTYTVTREVLTTQLLQPLQRSVGANNFLVLQASLHKLCTLLTVLQNTQCLVAYLNQWFTGKQTSQDSHLKDVIHQLETALEKEALSLYKLWGSGHLSIDVEKITEVDGHILQLQNHLEQSVLAVQKAVRDLVHHGELPSQANNDLNQQGYSVLTGYTLQLNGNNGLGKIKQLNTLSEIEKKGPGCLDYILDTLIKELQEIK